MDGDQRVKVRVRVNVRVRVYLIKDLSTWAHTQILLYE